MRPPGARKRFPKSVPVTAELRARLDEIAADRIMSVAVLVDVLLTRALDHLSPVEEILRPRPSPEVAAAMFGAAPWPDGVVPGWTRENGIVPSPAAARAIAEAFAEPDPAPAANHPGPVLDETSCSCGNPREIGAHSRPPMPCQTMPDPTVPAPPRWRL